MIKDPQPDHKAALVFAETYTTASMGQEQPRKYNLAACYLDLTQQLAELRKAARDSLDSRDSLPFYARDEKADAALRKLLEGGK